ncbi:MAG: hypothetical protein IKW06_02470 [Clostridia bacterium]|nr:hypothetical protein [Clostridia bacterium]
MEMKYYNPSNQFKAPIKREPKPYRPPVYHEAEIIIPQAPKEYKPDAEERAEEPVETTPVCNEKTTPFNNLINNQDDFLILGVLLILLLNNCDDYFMLLILGYLFLAGNKR